MKLGQAVDVFLNVFDTSDEPLSDEPLSDVISRHIDGIPWPDVADEPLSDLITRHPAGSWPDVGGVDVVERPPPGVESPFWYTVGPLGWFYWQWAALGAGALVVVAASDGGGRRRR